MTAATLHDFDAAIALDAHGHGATHPAWANMVGPFGGITAATLLNAAWSHPQRLGEPLALTVNYAGAVADGPFHIEALPVRTTRTTQHWTLALHQGGAVATTATAVFALRRDTWVADELPMPAVPPAGQVAVTPPPGRVVWPHRYEMRFVHGPWVPFRLDGEDGAGTAPAPAITSDESLTLAWVRDTPPRPLDALSLTALCDLFYPRIFRRRGHFTPAGTVSMTVHFHGDAADLAAQGTRPLLACARGLRFHRGFFDQRAELWSDGGQLLASSQQTVYYKA
jgi:acyl-coenzyme A thioesterase PaaI-like protein